MAKSDLTFFTNEPGSTLLDRFIHTLRDTEYFDVLVAYFRTSGFYRLYEALEDVEKIRVLVGLSVDARMIDMMEAAIRQRELDFESSKNTKDAFSNALVNEMEGSSDDYEVEMGVQKFIEFLTTDCRHREKDMERGGNGKKLEIRAYPSRDLHAKVYISRFSEEDRDYGRVLTGSSNFSEFGLVASREFNVELKNRADVEFALEKFEALWKDAVDISKEYVDTIYRRTWLNDAITPYELYLKFLYEYLKEDINIDEDLEVYLPEGFKDLEYQKQAMVAANKILEAYNGVFLADVVGLGKTYISALLAQQLQGKGRMLIICPPALVEYWDDTFREFGIRGYKVESLGKLDQLIRRGAEKYSYIFVDEAHRFRNEVTQGYEKLHQICWGKKVILVSATPLNNKIDDIQSQLKLFQKPRKSTIPGMPDYAAFFTRLNKELKRAQDEFGKGSSEYIEAVKQASGEIREKILKYVMVRRTRTEVLKYFKDDVEKRGLVFPKVEDPNRIIYEFDDKVDEIFNTTIDLIKNFTYARYACLLYLKKPLSDFEKQSVINVVGFMKGILVKRLESSFFAFKNTLRRFIESYTRFIEMYSEGTVYISKKVNVYDLIDSDDTDKLLSLVDQERVAKYQSDDFNPELLKDLNKDLEILKKIESLWSTVEADPKLEKFIEELKHNQVLKNKKLVIFSESIETGEYLFRHISKVFPNRVLFYCSEGGTQGNGRLSISLARDILAENYDANPGVKNKKDDIQILISTDVLAEGVNLHRSNIVINYDLPWNPTRVLQRVGRVNRVGTPHKAIHIFNFFPTAQSEAHINLEANVKAKIQAFHDALGEDAKYLTEEEEISSHKIFGDMFYSKLNDKKTYSGEEEEERSELQYLVLLRDIRDNNKTLFERVKRLPKKARSGRQWDKVKGQNLITFFRKGQLKKFFLANGIKAKELTFFDAVDIFECAPDTKRASIPKEYYELLADNKEAFRIATSEESAGKRTHAGRSNEEYIIRRLKARDVMEFKGFTDDDEDFIRSVLKAFQSGIIPKNTSKRVKNLIEKEPSPLKLLAILRKNIPENLLEATERSRLQHAEKREVILSEYLIGGE